MFDLLDFTTTWSGRFADTGFDAVTNSMALHHAADKPQIFRQVYDVLNVFGDFETAPGVGNSWVFRHYKKLKMPLYILRLTILHTQLSRLKTHKRLVSYGRDLLAHCESFITTNLQVYQIVLGAKLAKTLEGDIK